MKTPNEIKSWIDMLLSRRPNTEDRNYLEAIKCYMDKVERPRGEWVPVSERLPDYLEDILITFQKPNREPLVYRAVYIGSKFTLDNGDVWNWNDPEIKAWMPLPLPYEEDNENEEV